MSVTDDVPELDGADLLGMLFQDGNTEDPFFSDGNALMEDWFSEQDMLNGVDTEDFLSSLLGEDDCVPYLSHSPLGSDSGISDDSHNNPCQSDTDPAPSPEAADSATSPASLPDTQAEVMEAVAEAVQTDHCYFRQQEGDILESVRSEKPDTDVFIDLDDWDSTEVMQDQSNEVPCTLAMEEPSQCNKANQFQFQFQEIILTDEERRLLAKEGVSIPSHLPLTKAEERTLKRVRRKIRNKQSAQESRKKKKVYVDGLENRVAVCTAHNQELQKKVQMLQKENMSLIEQLRKLQALMKLTTMKTTTTSTCVMVFLLSFCLIIFPSVNPFGSSRSQKDVYTPSGVLSRTLRSIPENVERLSSMEVVDEDELLLVAKVENSKAMLSSGQNHTPDYQRVERPESESGVNSNSSSDFPNPANTELNSIAAGPEGRRDPSVPPVDYQVTGTKENWIDRKPTSVIIQQHRSDEM